MATTELSPSVIQKTRRTLSRRSSAARIASASGRSSVVAGWRRVA